MTQQLMVKNKWMPLRSYISEFDQRFADFKTHCAIFHIFADNFCFDEQNAVGVLQTQLIDIRRDSELKVKFGEINGEKKKTSLDNF